MPDRARSDPATAIVVAMLALVGAIFVSELAASPRPSTWALVGDAVVGVVGSLALPRTGRRPVAAALVFIALSAVFPTATPLAATATLWVATRRRLPLSVAVAAAGVGAQLLRQWWRPLGGTELGWWSLLVVAAYAALVGWGAWWQARCALLESLEAEQAERVEEARRAERARIAREMHDVLAHRLSLVAAYAGALEYHPDAPPEQLAEAASVIRTGAHQALDELREVIGVLRADGTAGDDNTRPQPTMADLAALVEESRRAGVVVDFDDHGVEFDPKQTPASLGRTVYRIVQETLTNARRHAPGQPVLVTVSGRPQDRIEVEVVNPVDVVGVAAAGSRASGAGLLGLAERVHLAGGHARARRDRGRGVSGARVATVAGVSRPVRVLIADDDALVRSALSLLLSGADGIEVVGEAADGDEVPAAIAACAPDVVLMDIRMPRVDGVRATERLRRGPRPPEVVMLTTFDSDENVLGALRGEQVASC